MRVAAAGSPSSVTRPASIQARSRLREYCGSARASAASKRSPAAAAGSVSAWVAASPALVGGRRRRAGPWRGRGGHAGRGRRRGVGYNWQSSGAIEPHVSVDVSAVVVAARAALRGGACSPASGVLLVALALGGCGLLPEVKDETATLTAEQLYRQAHDALLEGNYTRAIKLFETLEARFPYGRYAQQAILESARTRTTAPAKRRRRSPPATASSAPIRIIRTSTTRTTSRGSSTSARTRASSATSTSSTCRSASRRGCASRSPRSRSSSRSSRTAATRTDSIDRMRYLTNSLALYEVKVARYYYNRGAYVAAVNRAQGALITYPRTPAERGRARHAGQELRQARAGRSFATTRSAILQLTFPKSEYFAEAPPEAVVEVLVDRPQGRACGRRHGVVTDGRSSAASAENASTSASSRVRRIGGRLRQIRLPYGLSVSRGSQIISTPRSVSVRISRPAPCFRRSPPAAAGSRRTDCRLPRAGARAAPRAADRRAARTAACR